MTLKIDQLYHGESILHQYILHHVINQEKLQEFRGSYLKGLESNDISQSTEAILAFKDNLSYFLQPAYQGINITPFIGILDTLESYYKNLLPDEFYTFRWYQYSTLFFTYLFFSIHETVDFKANYLEYINTTIIEKKDQINVDSLLHHAFNRAGYWMATGSGKTLLMYATVYMYCKLFSPNTNTLYILVPSDELRKQHKQLLLSFVRTMSPIKDGTVVEFSSLPLFGDHEVSGFLTTISGAQNAQLSENSILLIDEAHKGASKEDGAFETLKNDYIAKNKTFLFEFSATFQEAFKNETIDPTKNIFNTYHLSSLYKYNLFDFNADGFGKDYIVQAVKKTDENEATDKRRLVCDSLINFALQLRGFRELEKFTQTGSDRTQYIKKETYLQRINDGLRIYKPLFLGLSWKLDSEPSTQDGKQSETTLTAIIKQIAYIFANLHEFKEQIIASNIDPNEFFTLLTGLETSVENSASLRIRYDKPSDEIKLWLGNSLMLINTGQNAKIAERLKEDPELTTLFAYQELLSSKRLFNEVDKNEDILFLFGSRKFIEGWDSKRPSTILLFKMGGTSTVVATQILGRGLRLYGINGDGYRHLNRSNQYLKNRKLEFLEQISLFGYDIDEFERFIEALSGDTYRVAVIKKREYAEQFRQYLTYHNINEDDESINDFFMDSFPILDETLDEGEEESITIEKLHIKSQSGKLHFIYKNEDTEKSMGYLKGQYDLISEVIRKRLEDGKVNQNNIASQDTYRKTYGEIFGISNITFLVKNIFNTVNTFTLSDDDTKALIEYIQVIELVTDRYSSSLDEHLFDLSLQSSVIEFYIEHLKRSIQAINNRMKNYKLKSIHTSVSHLKVSHLIDELRLDFQLKKKEDKEIVEVFFGNAPKLVLEKNFEDLSIGQQNIIKNMFIQQRSDKHLYERLFYLPTKRDRQYLHDLDDNDVKVRMPNFSPFELNLNKNEEQKIEKVLQRIKNSTQVSDYYDVFYLRNLVGKKGIPLRYEDINGEMANFYSDFLIWFIHKTNREDITVVYFEPKGDGIDKNRECKQEKLRQITSKNINPDIAGIFGVRENIGNSIHDGINVLGILEIEF